MNTPGFKKLSTALILRFFMPMFLCLCSGQDKNRRKPNFYVYLSPRNPTNVTFLLTYRPCVFYILDSDSRIHLWDLGVGDIYPAHTVDFEERVSVIGLNPELSDPRLKQMLALGMQNGRVEVHHLKADYRASDLKSCTKELDRFLHYVSII